jgi:hypothetical protein
MSYTFRFYPFTPAGRRTRLGAALLALAVLAGACGSADQLAPTAPGEPATALANDSLAPTETLAGPSFLTATSGSTPFGPFDLYRSWDAPVVSGFTGGILYASPAGIIKLLSAMRAYRTRAFLKMTGEHQSTYMTGGKFDFYKWRAATAKYNTSAIKAAVAAAVADGTLLGYSMIDEANRFNWGTNAINKAMLDRMAAYSKSIFPTLPTAAVVTYYWRPTERYRVLDAIISQTWKPTKSSARFRDEAVAAAKLNGVSLAFSLNLFAGPSGGTMTPTQIKDWTVTLGRASCGMFMWKYSSSLFSQYVYKLAFKEVAAKLAADPAPRCRRL